MESHVTSQYKQGEIHHLTGGLCVTLCFLPSDRGRVVGGLPDVVTIMEEKVRTTHVGGRGFVCCSQRAVGTEVREPFRGIPTTLPT